MPVEKLIDAAFAKSRQLPINFSSSIKAVCFRLGFPNNKSSGSAKFAVVVFSAAIFCFFEFLFVALLNFLEQVK